MLNPSKEVVSQSTFEESLEGEGQVETTLGSRIWLLGFVVVVLTFFVGYIVRLASVVTTAILHVTPESAYAPLMALFVFPAFFIASGLCARLAIRHFKLNVLVTEQYKSFYSWFLACALAYVLVMWSLFELWMNVSAHPRELFLFQFWVVLVSFVVMKIVTRRALSS